MIGNTERERGTARVMIDTLKIGNRDIERAVVEGLAAEGYDVDIVPEAQAEDVPFMPSGSTITVYRKEKL